MSVVLLCVVGGAVFLGTGIAQRHITGILVGVGTLVLAVVLFIARRFLAGHESAHTGTFTGTTADDEAGEGDDGGDGGGDGGGT